MRASLRYLIPTGEKPIYIASTGGADAALSIQAEFEDREVEIFDARELDCSPSLDTHGFALVPHTTSITDFYQFDDQRAHYEAEIKQLILEHTGASELLIFDHTLRSDSAEVRGEQATREPASVIHNDYSDSSAERRLRDLVCTDEADRRILRRYAIVNVWRTINHPIESSPLTCCDASTIAAGDLIASERRAAERVGELELVAWNPDHRWYWYPQMQFDEALLIKTFDSATDVARRSIHSAFDNPDALATAPPRESIESRAVIFYN